MSLLSLVHTLYKYTVSPLLGVNCRYYPDCSSYAVTAIERHGILYGSWLTTKRVLRCNPLCEGGVDHVPEK